MKTSKSNIQMQLGILDKKIKDLIILRNIPRPRSGWLKAIRTSLGISTRQLGKKLGVTHQVILRFEKGEVEGTATLESLQKLANAMNCQFVYAVVPKKHSSLDALLEEKASTLARQLTQEVSHSMKLEDQAVEKQTTEEQIQKLARSLREALDPRLWEN